MESKKVVQHVYLVGAKSIYRVAEKDKEYLRDEEEKNQNTACGASCWRRGSLHPNASQVFGFRRYNTNTSIDGGKLKSRLKYEFRYFEKYKNNRLDTACELLNCYNSNMSVSSKSFLEKVKNYKSSIRNRIAFLFYKDINCGIIASDVITRIIILFGCY